MDQEHLDALKALCDAATPGPWTAPSQYPWLVMQDAAEYNVVSTNLAGNADTDAAFIAAAREAVPNLLAALAEAQRERDEERAKVEALLLGDKALQPRIWLSEECACLRAERDAARADAERKAPVVEAARAVVGAWTPGRHEHPSYWSSARSGRRRSRRTVWRGCMRCTASTPRPRPEAPMARRFKARTVDVDRVCISLAKANDGLAAATARAERAEATEADLRATVERVRALHRQVIDSSWPEPGHCLECVDAGGDAMDYRPYPCPTIAALDAQRPAEGGTLSEAISEKIRDWEANAADAVAALRAEQRGLPAPVSATPPPSPSEPPDETYVIVRSIKARRPLVSLYRLSSGIWQRDGNGAVATWDELVERDEQHCPVPVGPLPVQALGCDDDHPSPEGEGADRRRILLDAAEQIMACVGDNRWTTTYRDGIEHAVEHLYGMANPGRELSEHFVATPAALDGGQPDTPAPTRSGEEERTNG